MFSLGRSTLTNRNEDVSMFCLAIAELVNSSMDIRRVVWFEGVATGEICCRDRYLYINYKAIHLHITEFQHLEVRPLVRSLYVEA